MVETCKIVSGAKVHEGLLKGSKEAAKAVSTTFGPYGRNVAITMKYNVPKVTKDGASVAGFIRLEDPIENIAAQLIKQAAENTAKVAGDGTTSTAILTAKLVEEAFKEIDKGVQPMQLKRELEQLMPTAIAEIKKLSKEATQKDVYNIAYVACNGDSHIAELVTEAFKIVGKEGIVSVADSRSYETTLDAVDGIRIERTHIVSALSNGNNLTKHNDCQIAVTDLDITTAKEALHLISLQEELKKPLLIICNDLTGVAAEVFGHNKTNYNIPIEIIRAPFIAEARKEACKDLAIVSGATLISKSSGWSIEDMDIMHCGSSNSVEITQSETNILGRNGDPEDIKNRVKFYEEKIKEDKQGLSVNYKKRLAFFTSGAAAIYVGGANETEVEEKKDRFDDTIRAVRSSLEDGYVTGGGLTYTKLAQIIQSNPKKSIGDALFIGGLLSLVDTILENSGVITANTHHKSVNENNIIDPTLVISTTIKNAIGAAIMIFTTDCVLIRKED